MSVWTIVEALAIFFVGIPLTIIVALYLLAAILGALFGGRSTPPAASRPLERVVPAPYGGHGSLKQEQDAARERLRKAGDL